MINGRWVLRRPVLNADGLRTYKKVGSTVHEYEYSGDKLFYEKRGNIRFYYRYDVNGNLAAITRIKADGTKFTLYPICNSRGDVEELRKEDGTLYARYVYDSWGNTLHIYNASGTEITDTANLSLQNPFRYRGYYFDAESGLYYLQSRYYDPVTGRFVNADSLVDTSNVLGFNMYAYCGNNPVNYSDPSGHSLVGAFLSSAFLIAAKKAVEVVVGLVVTMALAYTVYKAVDVVAKTVCDVVDKTKTKMSTRNQSVYVMRNQKNKVEYVGRTNDPVRRQREHSKDLRKTHLKPLEVKFTNLNKIEARIVEQVLISAYTLDNLDNARREIAKGNVTKFYGNIENIITLFENLAEDEIRNLIESR